MSAVLELVAIVAALWLVEGLSWVRRASILLRSHGGAYRVTPGTSGWGNDERALAFGNALPALGAVHVVDLPQLSIGDSHVVAFVAAECNPGGPTPHSRAAFRCEDLADARADGRRVLRGDSVVAATSTPEAARRLAEELRAVAALRPEKRERKLARDLARSLDEVAARDRLERFRAVVDRVRAPAIATFALFFVVLPVVGATVGLVTTWPFLLGSLVVLQTWSTVAFVRAHRALGEGGGGSRVALATSIALSPPVAMRAEEALARELFAGFHPLAAAAAVLSDDELERFAAGVLRDAHRPLPFEELVDVDARRAERQARERLARELDRAVERLALPRERLLAPPPRADRDDRSYCPRCSRVFTLDAGTCAECRDLPLVRFE